MGKKSSISVGFHSLLTVLSQLFATVDWGLLVATVHWSIGQTPPLTISMRRIEWAYMLAVIAQPLWAWAMVCIKMSVALMLLRLQRDKPWQRLLIVLMVVMAVTAVYNTIASTTQCIPLSATWDLLNTNKKAKCWSKRAVSISSTVVAVINILTDLIFSAMPITFLRNIQRPLRERIILGLLMGIGLFASSASIAKAVAVQSYGQTSDSLSESISIGLWSCLEEQLALIAACIPTLRSPFQKVLRHFNLISKSGTSAAPGYGYATKVTAKKGAGHSKLVDDALELNSATGWKNQSQSQEEILGLDHVGGAKGGNIVRTTEVTMNSTPKM